MRDKSWPPDLTRLTIAFKHIANFYRSRWECIGGNSNSNSFPSTWESLIGHVLHRQKFFVKKSSRDYKILGINVRRCLRYCAGSLLRTMIGSARSLQRVWTSFYRHAVNTTKRWMRGDMPLLWGLRVLYSWIILKTHTQSQQLQQSLKILFDFIDFRS